MMDKIPLAEKFKALSGLGIEDSKIGEVVKVESQVSKGTTLPVNPIPDTREVVRRRQLEHSALNNTKWLAMRSRMVANGKSQHEIGLAFNEFVNKLETRVGGLEKMMR